MYDEIIFCWLSWIVGMYKLKLGQYETRNELTTGTWEDNFWTVPVDIRTVQDAESTKSDENFGQYMMNFSTKNVNIGYVQVKIRTVQDNFWTVHVEYWTVQDNNAAKLGAIFGQYMFIFSTN